MTHRALERAAAAAAVRDASTRAVKSTPAATEMRPSPPDDDTAAAPSFLLDFLLDAAADANSDFTLENVLDEARTFVIAGARVCVDRSISVGDIY